MAIAIEDGAVLRQGHGTLGHRLDHDPICGLGALERIDLFSIRSGDDQSVHFAGANGAEGVLGFLQALPQLGHLGLQRSRWHRLVRRVGAGHAVALPEAGRSPIPIRIRSDSEMSPMNRRSGNGSDLTRVGAAMICSCPASPGC